MADTKSQLSNYLALNPCQSGEESKQSTLIRNHTLSLKVPIDEWPESLRQEWKLELFYLFPPENRSGKIDNRDCITLCHEVENCPRKKIQNSEDRSCSHFSQGICIMATTVANDFRPLSFGTIGAFNGISKQRVQQIYCSAQRKVILAAARDPVLREYYTALGLHHRNLPDPKQLASKMVEIIDGN